jgi:zinc protease
MGEAFEPSIANIESRMIRSKLPNGTKVSLLPKKNRGGATTATIRINYGDNQTLPGQSGIAALVRASLMRGTAKHTRQQIQDELSRLKSQITVGGALGITQLSIQTTGANLEATLRLAAEILKEPAFPPSEFEQARQAQLAALDASRTDPATLAPIALTRRINPYQSDSPFYTPTVDESIAQMQAATLDAAKAFHADLYGASAAQIAIAGEFDTAAVTKLSSELFGTWNNKRPYAESSHIYSRTEAAQPTIAIRDKANATVTAGQAFPVSQAHADYPALLLANYMMGGHSTSRLYVRIRGKEGLSYGVSSSLSADPKDNSAEWIMSAITNPTNAPKLIQVFQEEVAQALKDGFTPEEITAAKKGWSETRTVQRNQDTALAARIIVNDHNGRTLAFDGDLETKIAALTPEQINTTFRRYLDPARLVIIKAGDFPQ